MSGGNDESSRGRGGDEKMSPDRKLSGDESFCDVESSDDELSRKGGSGGDCSKSSGRGWQGRVEVSSSDGSKSSRGWGGDDLSRDEGGERAWSDGGVVGRRSNRERSDGGVAGQRSDGEGGGDGEASRAGCDGSEASRDEGGDGEVS